MRMFDLFRAFQRRGQRRAAPLATMPATTASFPDARTGIHPWLAPGDKLVATVHLDGQAVCQIDHVAVHAGLSREPCANFCLPVGASKALLTGTLTRAQDGKPVSFKRSWALVDAAAYTAVLHDLATPLGQRLQNYAAQLEALAQRHDDTSFLALRVERGSPVDDELARAEQRFGFALPPVLAQVLTLNPKVGDSYFHQPVNLCTVESTLRMFGHGSLESELDPDVLARYRRSVTVFIEVGDGLGALAYDPQGVWFWLHQESINEPMLFIDRHHRPASGEDAVLRVMWRCAVSGVLAAAVESDELPIEEGEEAIWVDSSHPRALMQLHFDGKQPNLRLRSYDHSYALL